MTIPMVAWMLFRGMGGRYAYEMAAAMVLPVVPFLCLVWFDVTASAWCGAYCATTIDRGHAGADALPPQYLLDSDVGRATDISPPNDSVNVFPEYARSETWTAVHIRQFVSTPFIVLAFSDTPGSSATPHPR